VGLALSATDRVDLKRRAASQIDAAAQGLYALSREIHANPEIAFEEHGTVARLLGYLRTLPSVEIEQGVGGLPTAFRASIGAARSPSIGVICEFDAVPGMGHSCGHNLIASGAVGVLAGLAPLARELPGRVVVIGSPAEEGRGGKIVLAERGAYDGLDAVLQVHPCDRHRQSGPTIGKATLAIEFRGVAAHVGSANDRGVNALDAVLQLFNGLNAMRQQVRDGCRLYGIITRGGDSLNTIPDHTAAQIGVRAQTEEYLASLLQRVEACARGAATATGCTVSIERPPLSYYPPMKLNRTLGRLLGETLRGLGEDVDDFPPGFEGYANDVAAVSRLAPAALLNYKIGRIGLAEHSVEFMEAAASEEGLRGMLLSTKTMALAAIDLLTDPSLLGRVAAEFKRTDA
jgi:amidohydrolase